MNETKKSDMDMTDTMDQTMRILLSMWREMKQCAEKPSCVLRRLSSTEQAKCNLILNKIKLPGSFEEDEEETTAPDVTLSLPAPSSWTNNESATDMYKNKDKYKRAHVPEQASVQKKSRSSLSFKDCMKAFGVEEHLIAAWSPEPRPSEGPALDSDGDDDSDEVDDGMKDFDLIKRVQFLGSSRSSASSTTSQIRARNAKPSKSSSTCAKPEAKAKTVIKPKAKAKQAAKPEAKAAAKPATKPGNFAALLND